MSYLFRALLLVSGGLLISGSAGAEPNAAKSKGRTANAELANPAEKGGAGKSSRKGGQSIAVLVNDEPITAYEIEQRASFIALQGGGGGQDFKAKAEARWKAIVQDPKTNERFKELLKKNNVQSQEEARALQTKYVKDLQARMVDQLKREARSGAVAGSRVKAQNELIDEKLKLQEAKRLNATTDEAEVTRIVSGIAERNKMTIDQFAQHMKGMGVDINTMKARFRAEISWREVVRRKFGSLVAITERDVDQFVANTSTAQADVELQVQRITLPVGNQSAIAQRIAEADALHQRYGGCATMSGLAASVPGAKFEDLGTRKPSSIPEPTRSLLLNASAGDLLPASIGQSTVELWALCSRKAQGGGDGSVRENAQNELRQKEFEVLAQKHLKDLRQDASIEIR
ncbi:peptidylprolyl isomerase [Hyphomicrobium sp. LHD-15]|uniref:peptidylprolyl isomerase n=1 Tax=Hyphomicrobium sp. LHD-15 TaxID=3072142 RepID=UPI00280CAB89|nr:peptidylprolyl isomerase [Hyphomicrobium sp. LHD-15]MDQ8700390.1 peptidylprolyl isomerase [Hyphomicrobium sp. LHD-15]